jgi:dihydropteroate synthase
MGVLNVTPDSFSDGGNFFDTESAVAHARQMAEDGADCIDVGGESTRPGSDPVSEEEELRRVIPVIEGLKGDITIPISIDTYKPRVAREALQAGASIINDVTGLTNPEMLAVAADAHVPVVVMHMQGQPKTMQENPVYGDVVADIMSFFRERIAHAKDAGVGDLILDPGIGFGKTLEHNLTILKRLGEFSTLGFPILVGASRKSFIGTLTGNLPASERLEGTLAASVIAVAYGASWVRVHDVKAHARALAVADAITRI